MTDERRALMAGIVAEPDDNVPRLVFADWLDDHGEPDRAELIRVQCAMSYGEQHGGNPTWDRAAELTARLGTQWFADLDPPPLRTESNSYARGLAVVTFDVERFAAPDCQRAAAERFPALGVEFLILSRGVNLRPVGGLSSLWRLAQMLVSGVQALEYPVPDEAVRAALTSPALGWVAGLALIGDPLTTDRPLGYLLGSPHVARLGRLSLTGANCSDAGLAALAQATTLPNLREFNVTNMNMIRAAKFTVRGLRAVLNSDRLPRLCRLGLMGATPTRVDLHGLLADPAVGRLTALRLSEPAALAEVATARTLTGLETLSVSGLHIAAGGRDFERLLDNPALARLREVRLDYVRQRNIDLPPATETRLCERFGDGWSIHYAPDNA